MTKHGDFCLSPKALAWALLTLLLVTPAFFAWGWFAPAMSAFENLFLAAFLAPWLAYPVKIVLKHVGEPGALWTRVVGCLSSAMIAFGHLGLTWAVGNGIRHDAVEPAALSLPIGLCCLLLIHLFQVLGLIPEDREEENSRPVGK